MTFDQGPQYQPKLGHPSATPGPDPRMIEAIAQALAERGYQRDASRAQQQFGMNDAGPNALQGGVVNPGFEVDPRFGVPLDQGGVPFGSDAGFIPSPSEDSIQNPGRGDWDYRSGQQGAGWYNDPGLTEPYQASAAPNIDPSMVQGLTEGGQNEAPAQVTAKPKAKKKGEYSDFFKALKAAKSGDKDVKKSFKDLAKQLASKEAGNAETTIATS